MKEIINYIKVSHIVLLLAPLGVLFMTVFTFEEYIRSSVYKYSSKITSSNMEHSTVTASYILDSYTEKNIKKDIFDILFSVEKEHKKPVRATLQSDKSLENLRISFIYIGKSKYVIINGNLYKEGDLALGKYKINRIEKEKVKIIWGNKEKWLYIYP